MPRALIPRSARITAWLLSPLVTPPVLTTYATPTANPKLTIPIARVLPALAPHLMRPPPPDIYYPHSRAGRRATPAANPPCVHAAHPRYHWRSLLSIRTDSGAGSLSPLPTYSSRAFRRRFERAGHSHRRRVYAVSRGACIRTIDTWRAARSHAASGNRIVWYMRVLTFALFAVFVDRTATARASTHPALCASSIVNICSLIPCGPITRSSVDLRRLLERYFQSAGAPSSSAC